MGADDYILDRPTIVKMKCLPIPNFNHEKLLSKINIDSESGCWNWTGYTHQGYGKMGVGKKDYMVHRLSYELFFGIKHDHTVIDHKCMNKICINPDHLREVTIRTNTIENSNCSAVGKKAQTHCIRGHEFTPQNTLLDRRGAYGAKRRNCIICAKETKRRWYLKNKGKKK